MSAKKRTGGADAPKNEVGAEADARAAQAARELRARREAALGPAPIDNKLHRELPLARMAYALFGITVLAYLASRLAARLGNAELELIASIATTLLFLVTFVTWFMSRHQAKRLTQEREGAGKQPGKQPYSSPSNSSSGPSGRPE